MERTVRLTERDLSRIVTRVIKEGLIESSFGAKIVTNVSAPTMGWPQKAGATGTWKEEDGAILLFDGSGKQIGSIEE